MSLKEDVKPITYLKNKTADAVRSVSESRRTMVITQHGEARVVVMDVETYDDWRRTLSLLKILACSDADVRAGRVMEPGEAFERARRAVRDD